ncbi:MAG: allophanate hydrolase subunit 1 [Actinobacteria bacterium]|nr:allophanate hydrolase subunit 1 [Actinomycetota bacterium]
MPGLLPCGPDAILVEPADVAQLPALTDALAGGAVAGVTEVVPAARTVLVRFGSPSALTAGRAALDHLLATVPAVVPVPDPGRTVTIAVTYDGPDLAEVAELTGLGVDGVVAAHTAAPWRVAFGGFAPGFAYLTGGDPRLQVPRRAEPRPSVPAGSVGLAGEFSGIYPRSSPGGWQLIGRTEAALWEPTREPPALLSPGRWVRFEAVP